MVAWTDIRSDLYFGMQWPADRRGLLRFRLRSSREAGTVRVRLVAQALQFDFTSKQLVGKAIELARMPIANPEIAVGSLIPGFEFSTRSATSEK